MGRGESMRRALLVILPATLAVTMAIAVGACGGGADGDGEARWLIGYSQCNRGEPWRQQMDTDIEAEAARHAEIELVMRDAQNEAFQQIAQVKEFISQEVDLLIISPKDTSLTEAVAEAFEVGIPVIVLDRAVAGDRFTCFIGPDNRKIGEAVAQWTIEKLGGKGTVVELKGLSSSTPGVDRSEPFHTALADTEIEIIFEADTEWLSDRARDKMLAALQRFPEAGSIDLVYGANDPAAIAAFHAAKDLGREGEMLFVGVDALPHEGLEAVRAGILDATFEYRNGADLAIESALKILAGETVVKKTALGTKLYTPENLESGGRRIE
jgi:ribose transport system substrate-binding protein